MKEISKNLGKAILITTAFLIVVGATMPFVYDMNDDLYMRAFVSGAYIGRPDAHMIFMGYPLGVVLSILYRIRRNIDWYGVYLIFCHFFCLALCLYRMISLKKSRRLQIVGVVGFLLTFSAIWLFRAVVLTFTTTAAILCATTIFWYASVDFSRNKIFEYGILALLVGLDFCTRSKMAYMMVPLAGVVFLYKNREHGQWREWRNWKPAVLVLLLLGVLVLVERMAYQGADWRYYDRFNTLRSDLFDYYGFPEYKENEEFYQSIGMSEDLETAIEQYSLILDERINAESLQAMKDKSVEIRREKALGEELLRTARVIVSNWFSLEYFPLNYAGMLLGILLAVYLVQRKDWLSLAWYGFAWFALLCVWFYLAYQGRFPARIGFSLHIFAFMIETSFLWILYHEGRLHCSRWLYCAGLVVIAAGAVYGFLTTSRYAHSAYSKNESYHEVLDYCEARNTNFYFMDVFSFSLYTDNFQLFLPSNEKNYMRFGDWMAYSPLYYEKLSHNGITNIVDALVHKDNVYLIARDDADIQYLKRYMKEQNSRYTYVVSDVIQKDGFIFYVYQWKEAPEGEAELPQGLVSEVTCPSNEELSGDMLDDDIATGWYCDSQKEGTEIIVTLSKEAKVSGIRLDVSDYADAARNLRVYASSDGEVWNELAAANVSLITWQFDPVVCRYLKLQLGEGEDNLQWKWAIQEMTVLGVQ